MLRAIFNRVGSSNKNNAWSCAVQFELYMQSLGKSSNFFDPISARFGKYIEMGLIVAANFKELKTFFETTFMPNNMFRVCELYLNCPRFYEIMIALSLIFNHILAPFLVAVGADATAKLGYKCLSHNQLILFYKDFVKVLSALVDDPLPLLNIARLPFVTDYNIESLPNRHVKMIGIVFEELDTNESICVAECKSIMKLICEEYLVVIDRQAGKFYIDSDSIVKKFIECNPRALDGVPTTSLACEHSVALGRRIYNAAPTSSTRTQSNFQLITNSPAFKELNSMDSTQLLNAVNQVKKSKQVQLYKKMVKEFELDTAKQAAIHFEEMKLKRQKVVSEKLEIIDAVKTHCGPLLTPEQVDAFCSNFTEGNERLSSIIHLEIRYQKVVVNDHTTNKDLYQGGMSIKRLENVYISL